MPALQQFLQIWPAEGNTTLTSFAHCTLVKELKPPLQLQLQEFKSLLDLVEREPPNKQVTKKTNCFLTYLCVIYIHDPWLHARVNGAPRQETGLIQQEANWATQENFHPRRDFTNKSKARWHYQQMAHHLQLYQQLHKMVRIQLYPQCQITDLSSETCLTVNQIIDHFG